jgi:predicted amidohydrolase
MIEPYEVALIQPQTVVVTNDRLGEAQDIMRRNLQRILQMIEWTSDRWGSVKLAAFSEYALMGHDPRRTVHDWIRISQTIPGEFTDLIGKTANKLGCYIVGNIEEVLPEFPGRFFNTDVIVSPEGKVILKYHKHNGPNNFNVTYHGPGDVYTEYVKHYGREQLFPVVDTEIGKLGCLTCTDITFPEVARCLALNGAEVLLNVTSEPYDLASWDVLRRARAMENVCWLVSPNAGAYVESGLPLAGYRGHSQLIDFDGNVTQMIDGPGEAVIRGRIDIESLRHRRSKLTHNFLLQLRTGLYAPEYAAAASRWPNDAFQENPISGTGDARVIGERLLADLTRGGSLMPPARG